MDDFDTRDKLTFKESLWLSISALIAPITLGGFLQNYFNNKVVIVISVIAYLFVLVYILKPTKE